MNTLFNFLISRSNKEDKTSEKKLECAISEGFKSFPEPPSTILNIIGGKQVIAQKVASEVTDFVKSNEFITNISNEIGMPDETETKEEFVSRCLGSAKKMLYARFGLK